MKKILIYADLNLNSVDGSSVWLVNLVKLLAQDDNHNIDVLLKYSIDNPVLIESINTFKNVKLLEAAHYYNCTEVNADNIAAICKVMDMHRDYSCIIIRGFEACKKVAHSELGHKLLPYLTDFNHNVNDISSTDVNELKYIYSTVASFFIQTSEMGNYLKDLLNVNGEKFHILSPIVFQDGHPTKYEKSIVYAGKIALDWNIEELIEVMDRLYSIDPEIHLHFVGDKFNRDMGYKKSKILNSLKNAPNITHYGTLPKDKAEEVIKKCKLGYGFRTERIDNDNSLEISVKFLEYINFNTLPLVRKTKIHSEFVGENYPLYITSVENIVSTIISYFSSNKEIEITHNYSLDNIKNNICTALSPYPDKRLRLLIVGHDLKFIKDLYPFFEQNYILNILEFEDYLHFSPDISAKHLLENDIIWCEWMLNNAEWFSNNVYPHQDLYIRAHRFELARNYGHNLNFENITCIIAVSYYYQEQFIEKFNIPRNKIRVINNFIDTERYNLEKNSNYKYNIALIGALPKRKGLHHAIEIIRQLKDVDPRYKLYIPGKRPEEFPNTWNIPDERAYYEDVYKSIKDFNLQENVIFNGWVNIPEFLKDIGYTLSLSDKEFPESFHISPMECMASKGIGLCLDWEGIEYIYPEWTIYQSTGNIIQKILDLNHADDEYDHLAVKCQEFVSDSYDISIIKNTLNNLFTNKE